MEEQKGLRITIAPEAYDQLHDAALADLSNGGRGIGNQVEALLINPLARWLFDNGIIADTQVRIDRFDVTARPPAVACQVVREEDDTHA